LNFHVDFTDLLNRFLGKDAKSRMGVLECSLANAFIPFVLLPGLLLIFPEYKRWGRLSSRGPQATVIITLLCFSLTMSKHADRLSKFSIVSAANTMFFAAVDSNMKVIAGIGSFLFFDQSVTWAEILGFVLVFFSLIVMVIDKRQKYMKALASATEKPGPEISRHATVVTIETVSTSSKGSTHSLSVGSFGVKKFTSLGIIVEDDENYEDATSLKFVVG
jgi:hypothetical protein